MRSNMVFEPTEVAVTFCTIWAVKVFQFALSRIYQLCTSRISIVTLFTSFSVIIAQLVQKLTKTMTSEQTISVINMEKTFLGYPLVQTHMFPIQTRVVATFCTRLANISFFDHPLLVIKLTNLHTLTAVTNFIHFLICCIPINY